jgi:hypothetical protein
VIINGSNDTVTMNPGVFTTITINGSNNQVTFNAGVYVFASGGSGIIDNGTTTLDGTGVTFYIAPGAGAVTINGSNSSNLSAPTTGAYAGMLFWQAPADSNTFTINGSNGATFNGIMYAPKAPVTINGGNSVSAYFLVVAYNLLMNGSSILNLSDNAAGLAHNPMENTALVE